ncbi:hypothetical protein SAMN04490194_1486 [Pseudomonas migulae]|uniref:Uncharacterized protein n=1 Tax=Pseudomonas migulae TaxID=78543 RepID=A0A1H5H6F8_9PSED|nr:hypothetical protein SAMN04490194_1486 [Pseudomonas migulae]
MYISRMSVRSSEGERGQLKSQVGFQAASAAVAVVAPSRGRAQVLRSGQPGMDAGLAAPGHGWPMAAGPRSRTGARHRTKGARALGYLALLQVTRRKGETIGSRDRSNGYAPPQKPTNPHPPKALAVSNPLEFQKNPAVLTQGPEDEPVVNPQDAKLDSVPIARLSRKISCLCSNVQSLSC